MTPEEPDELDHQNRAGALAAKIMLVLGGEELRIGYPALVTTLCTVIIQSSPDRRSAMAGVKSSGEVLKKLVQRNFDEVKAGAAEASSNPQGGNA